MKGATNLTVQGLAKSFGDVAVLRNLDLDVPAGSLTALLGPSGCGKTTLLRLIAGFEPPDDGTVAVGDTVVCGTGRPLPPERRRVGYVPQEGALFPHLTTSGNITFGLPWAARRSERRSGRRIAELLELVGLEADCAGRFPAQLSGGQQQRVALARALAPGPGLVLLDEPFSSLDPALRAETREAVIAALKAAGTTTVLVTHDQAEALSLAERVAVMRDGRIVQTAAPATLYRSPTDPAVARFVGDAVLLSGHVRDGVAECALGRLPAPAAVDGPAEVLLRPEQIELRPAGAGAGVRARVAGSTYYGHDATVEVRLLPGDAQATGSAAGASSPAASAQAASLQAGVSPIITTVIARTAGHQVPRPGEEVTLDVHGEAVTYPLPAG
ncbi:MAG: ABC transporter ATP-binding protein [Streptosporangiaceae bacterium]